jgi:hypothetical protein
VEPEITVELPKTRGRFCETVIANHSESWPPSENALAHQFVSFFGIDGLLGMEELERLCQTIGVEVRSQELPKPLRGHNCTYEGKREIVVGTVQGAASVLGSREHTLLHELREVIEYEFRRLGHPIATDFSDMESRAEGFAGLVRAGASLKTWEWYFEAIEGIESRLLKIGAIILFAVLAMGHYLACVNLPHWEDQFSEPRD